MSMIMVTVITGVVLLVTRVLDHDVINHWLKGFAMKDGSKHPDHIKSGHVPSDRSDAMSQFEPAVLLEIIDQSHFLNLLSYGLLD